MNKLKLILALFWIAAGIFFYSGCSASSSSIRYKDSEEAETPPQNTTRFTSNDSSKAETKNTRVTYSDIDTLNYSDSTDENDDEDLPVDDPSVDISSILQKYGTATSSDLSADNGTVKEKMLMEIIKYLNTPYKYGGNSKKGIDCSAFTKTVYNNILSIPLSRTAREQFKEGKVISNINDLKFGDLVFFNTRRRVKPGHVGIYIGDKLFAHSSSKHGVTISSLDHTYYERRFMGGRRIEDFLGANNF